MDEEELRRNLAWVQQRLEALDKIEVKLLEMKSLAELARDHKLDQVQINTLNLRIRLLKRQVNVLDMETRQDKFLFDA